MAEVLRLVSGTQQISLALECREGCNSRRSGEADNRAKLPVIRQKAELTMEERESAGEQTARHQHQTDQNPPFNRKALVVADVDFCQPHQQID